MRRRTLKLKESDIQRQVLDYLTAKKIFHYRNNSGAFKTDRGGFYRFGALGSPDIVCVIKGRYVGIEIKGTKGVQSDYQKQFEVGLTKAGGMYMLVRSIDEVIQKLTNKNES